MKSIALLATALFLASAPSPDSDIISEISAGFLHVSNVQPLLAATTEQPTVQSEVTSSEVLTANYSDKDISELSEQ
jgi:hypothetical protein